MSFPSVKTKLKPNKKIKMKLVVFIQLVIYLEYR